MNIIGKEVTHTKFGAGTIVEVEGNKMQVDFGVSIRTFIYPDSFEKHFSIQDKKAEEYIHTDMQELSDLRKADKVKAEKEESLKNYIRKLKVKANSHAVFGMNENDMNTILEEREIFTGKYVTGAHKGQPRLPKSLSMNSACLLTMLPKGSPEAERVIMGIAMTADNFSGADCKDGQIPMHEAHQIIWDFDQTELLFWNYFPEEQRLAKWGSSEMKYVSSELIQKILEDMVKVSGDLTQENAIDFYQYFRDINRL